MHDETGAGTPDLARLISVIHRTGQAHAAAALDGAGAGAGQAALLMELARRDDVAQDELAGALRIDKGNVARRLAALEKAGLVRRDRPAHDRRVRRVTLTPQGRAAARDLDHALATWANTLTRGFSTEERALLPLLLQRMAVNAARFCGGSG